MRAMRVAAATFWSLCVVACLSGCTSDTVVLDAGSDAGPRADAAGSSRDAGPGGASDASFAPDAPNPADASVNRDASAGDAESADAPAGDAVPAPRDAGPALPDAAPRPCAMDDECTGGFCRPRQDGGMECHPYSNEGESCGGFRPPWTQTRCTPALQCMSADPRLADAPGTCLLEATVGDLTGRNASMFAGRIVGVESAFVVVGTAACTRQQCSPQMPCCNTCNASERLAETAAAGAPSIGLTNAAGMDFACSGTNCDYQDQCPHPRGRYRVIGRFVATPAPPAPLIQVTTIRPYF